MSLYNLFAVVLSGVNVSQQRGWSVCVCVCGIGLLPVRGVIPDMTSDSDKYIHLQSIYRDQAAADVVAVTTHLLRILQTIGRVIAQPVTHIQPFKAPATIRTLHDTSALNS